VRERDRSLEAELAQQLLGEQLVGRVRVGVQEGDGDRLDAVLAQRLERPGDVLADQLGLDRAVGHQPLGDGVDAAARHQRRRVAGEDVVEVVAVGAADLEHVAEAARRQQPHHGAAPLEQRVEADRGAVDEELGGGEGVAADRGVDRVADPLLGRRGRRELLRDPHLARALVIKDQVGKRASDVYTEACGHSRAPFVSTELVDGSEVFFSI
jgi:hypothetical protein